MPKYRRIEQDVETTNELQPTPYNAGERRRGFFERPPVMNLPNNGIEREEYLQRLAASLYMRMAEEAYNKGPDIFNTTLMRDLRREYPSVVDRYLK